MPLRNKNKTNISKMLKGRIEDTTRLWNALIGFFLILFVLHGVYVYWYKLAWHTPGDRSFFQLTEILISYSGGFVRRGLSGELLYQASLATGINGLHIGCWICLLLYLSLLGFFIFRFSEKGLCWWLLCSPLMFGFTDDIIRKDFLLMWVSVGIYMLLRHRNAGISRRVCAGLLVIFALLVHEAYLFWGVPLTLLLILNGRHKTVSWCVAISVIAVFVLMCFEKGSAGAVRAIVDSWNKILPGSPLTVGAHDAINALGWDMADTFRMHMKDNIGYENGSFGLLMRPIPFFFAYYIGINFLYVFRHQDNEMNETDRTNIGSIYILLLVCLLPMLTVLSCDYGRTQQFAFMTTMTAFVILDRERIQTCFPVWYVSWVRKLNVRLDKLMPPSKGWLLLMLLLWGESRSFYDPFDALKHSIIGSYAEMAGWLTNKLISLVYA